MRFDNEKVIENVGQAQQITTIYRKQRCVAITERRFKKLVAPLDVRMHHFVTSFQLFSCVVDIITTHTFISSYTHSTLLFYLCKNNPDKCNVWFSFRCVSFRIHMEFNVFVYYISI